MKKLSVSVLGVVVLLLGLVFYYGRSNPVKRSDSRSSVEEVATTTNRSSSKPTEAHRQMAGDKPAPQIKKEYRAQFKFNDERTFGVAEPSLSLETIQAQFIKGSVLDGILIKADFHKIKSSFEHGMPFEVPQINGSYAVFFPIKVSVNQDGTTIFWGGGDPKVTQAELQGNSNDPRHEVELIFLEESLLSGKVTVNNETFMITKGREGNFLVKTGPIKVD